MVVTSIACTIQIKLDHSMRVKYIDRQATYWTKGYDLDKACSAHEEQVGMYSSKYWWSCGRVEEKEQYN
jgi:hypothetical protein